MRVTASTTTEPLRYATRAWLEDVVADCIAQTADVILPAMERGAVVIADGWLVSAFLRAKLGRALKKRHLAPHIFETAEDALHFLEAGSHAGSVPI